MTTFRSTARLLKAMKAKPAAETPPPAGRLGDWTANPIRVGRIQLVLAVSEPTRMGLVVDAAPYAGVQDRLAQQLFKALTELGVAANDAAEEAELLRTAPVAASNSRSVLGTINQFAWQVECNIRYGHAFSAWMATLRLLETVVLKPEHVVCPADRVREAFGLPIKLRGGPLSIEEIESVIDDGRK